jgi:hypothetical protein
MMMLVVVTSINDGCEYRDFVGKWVVVVVVVHIVMKFDDCYADVVVAFVDDDYDDFNDVDDRD